MKLLFASDIHGSARWCRALMEAIESEAPDTVVLLGDLLYHGPRNDLPDEYAPKEVIPLLNGLADRVVAVRGNCEAEVDQMVLSFPVMADYFLLPVGGKCIFATHGHIFNEQNLPPLKPGDILLHGHTHVSVCRKHDTYTCCNPGSVSIPKENTPRGYMILENSIFTWKTLDGTEYMKLDIEE